MPAPEAQPDKYSPERLAEKPRPPRPPAGVTTPGRRATDRPAAARTRSPSVPEGHPSAPVPGHPAAAAPARPAIPARASAAAAAPAAARSAAPARPAVPAPQAANAPAAEPAARATPWSTAPTGLRADRPRPASAALAAGLRAPAQPGTHPSGPIYGDWTRPSRSGPETDEDRAAVPPATTAIPERDTARGGRRGAPEVDDDEYDDHDGARYDDDEYDDDRYEEHDRFDDDVDEPAAVRSAAPMTDPGTGPSTMVRGGRAKDRLARQAADEKRRKELKAGGETMTAKAYLAGDDLDEKRSPRRMIIALVAVAIVALGVLGVYSFVSPATKQASSGTAATSSSAAAPASGIADATLPELSISPPPVVAGAPADAKAPVTVLNETGVTGLAGRIAGQLQGQGWETPTTEAYPGSDIAVTTVYYTDGDTNQQQAAQALVNQFPQIHGPAVRFFDVPGQADPGLVVVAAGDWQP